jgi:Fe-S-cluster containining protein
VRLQPIHQDLPDLYRKFFPEFFEELIPVETYATCNDCAMCLKPGEVAVPGVAYFKPNVKCCSYFPKLPNYLVGGLLADNNPAMDEGRKRIREKIRNRIGITPQAVDVPKKYNVLIKSGGIKSFGKNSSLICPYFVAEGGLCSIWKFRDSMCSTYFCKSVAGKQGLRFWNVLHNYLNQAQDTLSWYALDLLNCDIQSIWDYVNSRQGDELTPEDLDEIPPDEETYRNLWGDWFGREEDFYRECYRLVEALTKEEFDRQGGINQRISLKRLQNAQNDVVHPKIPPVLRKNPELKAFETPDGKVTVLTHVGFYSIQKTLFDVLGWFDGVKTTAEIQKMVYEKYQADLNDDYIVPMFLNQMILPA